MAVEISPCAATAFMTDKAGPSEIPAKTNIKLFVGRVPTTCTEDEVKAAFEEHGRVVECQIIREKQSGAHKNSAFVKMASITDADKAIRAIHGKQTLPGQTQGPMQVRYATGEVERLGLTNEASVPGTDEATLFVGSLPRSMDDETLKHLFSPYGDLLSAHVLRDGANVSKGCGFAKFSFKEDALRARDSLNGLHTIEGSNRPLDVRFATAKGANKTPTTEPQTVSVAQASTLFSNLTATQQTTLAALLANPAALNSLLVALQSPQLCGIANQITQSQKMPANWKEFQATDGSSYYYNEATGATTWQRPIEEAAMCPTMYAQQAGACPTSIAGLAANNAALAANSALMTNPTGTATASNAAWQQAIASQLQPTSSICPTTMKAQDLNQGGSSGTMGPPGANLFLFHIPPSWRQQDIYTHFSPFGRIVNATVPLDPKNPSSNKGFAFVGYDDVTSAAKAVTQMNGMMVGSKRLKVSIKKGEEEHAAAFLKAVQ
eukprot:Selendium_serpulae@DN3832_c0_g1_i2.p1